MDDTELDRTIFSGGFRQVPQSKSHRLQDVDSWTLVTLDHHDQLLGCFDIHPTFYFVCQWLKSNLFGSVQVFACILVGQTGRTVSYQYPKIQTILISPSIR